MLHIKKLEDGIELYKALGSELRIEIMKLLLEKGEMNMNEIASCLGITNGALTSHVRKLENCGLIQIVSEVPGHGNQKICRLSADRILIDIRNQQPEKNPNRYTVDIPVGQYTDYDISPTCGIATAKAVIGEVDDPRYFAHPSRTQAGILWFGKGFVEYLLPNFLPAQAQPEQIILSAEIASEAPGVNNDWPSDISFSINDVPLGNWTSPGDYGDTRGIFTPDWWFSYWNQYGLLKTLIINREGTFLDGQKLSDIRIDELKLDHKSPMRFRFSVAGDALHVGGLTLFGKNFGNYDQDIHLEVSWNFPIA